MEFTSILKFVEKYVEVRTPPRYFQMDFKHARQYTRQCPYFEYGSRICITNTVLNTSYMVLEPHPKTIQMYVHSQPYLKYTLPLLLTKCLVKKLCSWFSRFDSHIQIAENADWFCGVLQYVAVCCNVLQRAAVCCSVLQFVAVCCCVLQCVVVCCSVLLCIAVDCSVLQCVAVCVAVRCSELQSVAQVLQYAAMYHILYVCIYIYIIYINIQITITVSKYCSQHTATLQPM